MKVFRLGWQFFKVGAMNELQYRVNFFLQVLQSLVALATGLVGLALVFRYTTELGWTRPELLAVMGVHILMGGVIRTAIQPNMQRLMGEIQNGNLDFALTKSTDAQTLISVREISIWKLVDVLIGLIVIGVAVAQLHQGLGIRHALAFVTVLLLGAVMIYCFWLILTTGAFWIIRMGEILELFQGLYQAGRYPVYIYPDWLRTGLTFLVPIAFAVTVPAEALTARLNGQTLLLTALLTGVLLFIARGFWKLGVRNYSGASA